MKQIAERKEVHDLVAHTKQMITDPAAREQFQELIAENKEYFLCSSLVNFFLQILSRY